MKSNGRYNTGGVLSITELRRAAVNSSNFVCSLYASRVMNRFLIVMVIVAVSAR